MCDEDEADEDIEIGSLSEDIVLRRGDFRACLTTQQARCVARRLLAVARVIEEEIEDRNREDKGEQSETAVS